MYSDILLASRAQHSAHLPTTEQQRTRRNYYLRKTVQHVVAVGLVGSDSRPSPRINKRTNAGRFNVSVRELAPQRSKVYQVLPSCWQPKLDQLTAALSNNNTTGLPNSNTIGFPPASTDQHSLSGGDKTGRLPTKTEHHKQRNSMLNVETRNRRERTFVGSICAACDEPLEHILRGERILQLSCGHISHEACFDEYFKESEIKNCPSCDEPLGFDSSRGGNVDFDNLNTLARRSSQTPELQNHDQNPDMTPVPWEDESAPPPSLELQLPPSFDLFRDLLLSGQEQVTNRRHERRPGSNRSHGRAGSGDTSAISSNGYPDSQQHGSRRHEDDLESVEESVPSVRHSVKNAIPAPSVTVRIEVVDGKWQPRTTDLLGQRAHSPTVEEILEAPGPRPFSMVRGPVDSVHEDSFLQRIRVDLAHRVENWHGLECEKFGRLLLHGHLRVGKDRQTWQELECYLFSEMLICIKEKKIVTSSNQTWDDTERPQTKTRCTLKGSILVKKHLSRVETSVERDILTLHLTVTELPAFHLQFRDTEQLDVWRRTLLNLMRPELQSPAYANHIHATVEEYDHNSKRMKTVSSAPTSHGSRSQGTAPTEYTNSRYGAQDRRMGSPSLHVPVDVVVVVPVTPSMQGLKVNVLRDTLRFLVANLGARDRMGLVTFGSGSGAAALVGMANKNWSGWASAIDSIRPIGVKNFRADVVEGANVAIDLLMLRRTQSQLSHVVLISDSSTSDQDSVDFVVSRAEAAKIAIHSFGLGLTHKPDTMVAMSTKTKASYTYVKDWLMLRESLAGCLGSLQSISHQNVKVKLRLPEGSPAKFIKISGAIQITKRATGRDAEASLGDLRFGDKRDILVQLAIQPDNSTPDPIPSDPWESMISGLEALGPIDQDESRTVSVEELPLIQADLTWRDVQCEGRISQLPRPSLLAIAMLPTPSKKQSLRPSTSLIPPHPSVVRRRMELLTSDMLARALGLVARGQNDRAQHLLSETRSILKGLSKGDLPPLPTTPPNIALPSTPRQVDSAKSSPREFVFPLPPRSPNLCELQSPLSPVGGIDRSAMTALDSELESSLEWICHPTVFGRDTRKHILQAIGVISSQRGYTFRTPSESLWAQRVPGIKRLTDNSYNWREVGEDEALLEVSEPNTSTEALSNYR